MFVIELIYKKPLSEIDQHLVAHRLFLQKYYDTGVFIASGPKNPRNGGIIIALAKDQNTLETIIQQDPFYQYHLADYRYISFNPIKICPALESLLK